MKVVVAIDSLKGSLSSLEAGEAIKSGVLKAMPNAEVCVRPLADGGEGTVEALALGMGGELKTVEVTGPLGEKVNCLYGILEESKAEPWQVQTLKCLTIHCLKMMKSELRFQMSESHSETLIRLPQPSMPRI